MFPGAESVVIYRKTSGAVDAYGNPSKTLQQITVNNVLVAFGSSTEPVEVARNPIDSMLTLYFPHGTVVQPEDEFQVRGQMWVKEGDPSDWATINNFEVGVVVQVRRRRG